MVGAGAMGGVWMSRTSFEGLAPEIVLRFRIVCARDPDSLTGAIRSIYETEEKCRGRVGLGDACKLCNGSLSELNVTLLGERTGQQM